MIKEQKIEFTAKWCKYSQYKIVDKEGKYYILPEENSIPSIYDPFDLRNNILKDLLYIGFESSQENIYNIGDDKLRIEVQSKSEKFQNLILDFVNKYGLLGTFRYLPQDFQFMNNEKAKVDLGIFDKNTSAIEFEKRYFCFDPEIDWSRAMKNADFVRNSGLDEHIKKTEGNRLNDIVFSKYYAESVIDIINFAERLYHRKDTIFSFLSNNMSDIMKDSYESSIKSVRLTKSFISYGIENGKLKFKWDFMSLCAIVELMLILNETDGRTEVRLCKHCRKPFIAHNIKAEYDTTRCRNKENINKTRNRKKMQNT